MYLFFAGIFCAFFRCVFLLKSTKRTATNISFITALTLFYQSRESQNFLSVHPFFFKIITHSRQFITLPASESHRHYMTEISPEIQKYHYHRYVSSPRTTAVHFVRSLSLNAFASTDFFPFPHAHPETIRSRHIMAHLHSGYTYPHVLYVSQYLIVNFATIQACMHHTSEGHVPIFFILPLHRIIHFFSLFCSKGVRVLLYVL